MHLSRLGAEIVLWSSEEFGFLELGDSFTSGSSIMPQKKNPDAAELLRAKAPRVAARPVDAAGRDARPAARLQQGHAGGQGAPVRRGRHAEPVPRGRRPGCCATAAFNRERLAAAAGDEFLAATDIADLLVRRGVPFRESHAVVGRAGAARARGRQAPVRAHPRGAGRRSPTASTTSTTRCCPTAPGWSRRCPRAAPRRHGCREQLERARAVLAGVEP